MLQDGESRYVESCSHLCKCSSGSVSCTMKECGAGELCKVNNGQHECVPQSEKNFYNLKYLIGLQCYFNRVK